MFIRNLAFASLFLGAALIMSSLSQSVYAAAVDDCGCWLTGCCGSRAAGGCVTGCEPCVTTTCGPHALGGCSC